MQRRGASKPSPILVSNVFLTCTQTSSPSAQLNRRKQLQELLSADVNTAIPASAQAVLDVSSASVPSASAAPAPRITTTAHRSSVPTNAAAGASHGPRPSGAGAGSGVSGGPGAGRRGAGAPSSSSLSSSSSAGRSFSGHSFPTLAPSVAAKIAAGKQQHDHPGAALVAAASAGAGQASSSPPSSSSPSGPLTYKQRLQLNARYSLHGGANSAAAIAVAAKLQAGRVSPAVSPAGAAPPLAPSLSSPPRPTAASGPHAVVVAVDGPAAGPLLRSASPVTVPGVSTPDRDRSGAALNDLSSASLSASFSRPYMSPPTPATAQRQRTQQGNPATATTTLDGLDRTLHSAITADDEDGDGNDLGDVEEDEGKEDEGEGEGSGGAGPGTSLASSSPPRPRRSGPPSAPSSPPLTVSPSPQRLDFRPSVVSPAAAHAAARVNPPTFVLSPQPAAAPSAASAASSSSSSSPRPSGLAAPSRTQTETSMAVFLRQLDDMDSQAGLTTTTTGREDDSAAPPAPAPTTLLRSPPRAGAGPRAAAASDALSSTAAVRAAIDAALDGGGDFTPTLAPVPSPAPLRQQQGGATGAAAAAAASPDDGSDRLLLLQLSASGTSDSLMPGGGAGGGVGAGAGAGASTNAAAVSAYASVRAKVVAMTVELEEKGRTIAVMRSQLAQARRVLSDKDAEWQSRVDAAVAVEREAHEAALADKLLFVERLLEDKAALKSHVAELGRQLTVLRAESEARAAAAEETLRLEVDRAREAVLAQERARKEAWALAKTKEIKERTLRGLEPDIQRLLDKHTEEIGKIQAACADEIAAAAAHFARERDAALAAAAEAAGGEAAKAAERERQAARAREAALREEADRELALARDRYRGEVEEERRRASAAARADASRQLGELGTLQAEWQARLDDLLRRHADEKAASLRAVADAVAAEGARHAAEREALEGRLRGSLRREYEEREREARADMARSRDEQLRLVIARFDSEAQEERRKARAELEAALSRAREEGRAGLEGLREEANRWRARAEESVASRDAAIASHGDAAVRLQALLDEARAELADRRAEVGRLVGEVRAAREETAREADAARARLDDARMVHAKEAVRLKDALEAAEQSARAAEARRAAEAEEGKAAHARELEEVQARVQVALRRRDEAITSLRARVAEEGARAETATRLMREARAELLGED